jgi:hypothetical protein
MLRHPMNAVLLDAEDYGEYVFFCLTLETNERCRRATLMAA